MDLTATSDEIAFDFMPFFRGYKDGRVERHINTEIVPTSLDSRGSVLSKDVVIVSETGVSARLFLPSNFKSVDRKLPLLIYFHGGAFCFGSPFCAMYNNYVTSLVAKAKVIALSVDYRLAPEHPLPAAYEDAWDTLKWVASHSTGHGPESWLNEYADFQRVFLAGDSAGANISHNMAIRAGIEELAGLKLFGICVVQPDFVGKEGSLTPAWPYVCPATSGENDTRINPAIDPKLSSLGCSKMLVCVAEKDAFRDGGWIYYEAIKKSGWPGEVEIVETPGEDHVFHLFNPTGEKAIAFLDKIASFINQ